MDEMQQMKENSQYLMVQPKTHKLSKNKKKKEIA